MKRHIIFTHLLFFALCSNYLSAQGSYRLTVSELFDKGVENSLHIQASIVKTKIARSDVSLAKTDRLPNIMIGGTMGFVGKAAILDKGFDVERHSNTPRWKQNYQIALNQPLYEGGRIQRGIEKAQWEEEIAGISLSRDKQDLKLWLMSQYLDLFTLYKKQYILNKNIEEAKVRLHDIEKMKEQGMITTNDVLRSQLLLTNYELECRETQNDISLASQRLAIVLGLDEDLILEPDTTLLSQQWTTMNEKEYVELAYSQYPDLKLSETSTLLAKNNLRIAQSTILPTLSLEASNSLARPIPNTSPAQDLYINAWGITLNLSYNVSSWFEKKHRVGKAKQEIYLQQLAEDQAKQDIRTEVRASVVKFREAEDRIMLLNKSLTQAEENYRIVKNKYFNQLAILTDLLDAEDVRLQAELNLIIAQTRAIYSYYQLQKVSGNI